MLRFAKIFKELQCKIMQGFCEFPDTTNRNIFQRFERLILGHYR